MLYVKEQGSTGNKEHQELTGVKEHMATSELGDFIKKDFHQGWNDRARDPLCRKKGVKGAR